MLKIFSVLFAVFGVGLLIVTSGIAHPVLLDDEPDTVPNPGQVLEVSPDAIELFFDERSLHGGMNGERSIFYVVKLPASSVVAIGTQDLSNPFRDSMRAELTEPLEHGEYVIRWIGVSNADDGYTEGIFNFFVGENAEGVGIRNEQGTAVGGSGEGHDHSGGEEESHDSHGDDDSSNCEDESHSEEEMHGDGEEGGHSEEGESEDGMHGEEDDDCATEEEENHEHGDGE